MITQALSSTDLTFHHHIPVLTIFQAQWTPYHIFTQMKVIYTSRSLDFPSLLHFDPLFHCFSNHLDLISNVTFSEKASITTLCSSPLPTCLVFIHFLFYHMKLSNLFFTFPWRQCKFCKKNNLSNFIQESSMSTLSNV